MQIQKRDGTYQNYNETKIQNAICKCLYKLNYKKDKAKDIAKKIEEIIREQLNSLKLHAATVEQIQDLVEGELLKIDAEAFTEYSLYRQDRENARKLISSVSFETVELFEQSRKHFPTPLQLWQYFDKTARYNYEKGRRETWSEAISERTIPFLKELSGNKLPQKDYDDLEEGMLNCWIMSSMRLLATAGEAARRDNVAIYNCSFHPVNDLAVFGEFLYISMAGCGVGFSCEKNYISLLPEVQPDTGAIVEHVVDDSTEGWVAVTDEVIRNAFKGITTRVIFTKVRKAGSILKTKGGIASGPEPLRKSLAKIVEIIRSAVGRRLYSDELADICCLLGECAVSGGHRRSAMIGIFDFDDERMLKFKDGWTWFDTHPWRQNANVSIALKRRYNPEEFKDFVQRLNASGSGEPGLFSVINAILLAPERRKKVWEKELGFEICEENAVLAAYLLGIGCNPCGEINLRTFCNLTINILEKGISWEEIKRRHRLATILGTIQSCATNFRILRPHWKKITEQERLLGVDLLGLADIGFLTEEQYEELKQLSIDVNKEYAELLGIEQSTAITTNKPGGNSSTLFNRSSSSSHRKYRYGYRHVEVSIHSVIYKVLHYSKVPGFPKPNYENSTYIFKFPLGTPDGVKTQEYDDLKEQLHEWLKIKKHYTEHNPSVSIYFKQEQTELDYLSKWLYENQNIIGGQAFFPQISLDGLVFEYLPIQSCSQDEYEEFVKTFPKIHWELLSILEKNDTTTSGKEVACAAGQCTFI
jgi:ribonucleoside-diphosphate reductase alpha chain